MSCVVGRVHVYELCSGQSTCVRVVWWAEYTCVSCVVGGVHICELCGGWSTCM